MHSDHFHPGCNVRRPTSEAPTVTTSTLVFSGVRTSSGLSRFRDSTPAMVPP